MTRVFSIYEPCSSVSTIDLLSKKFGLRDCGYETIKEKYVR